MAIVRALVFFSFLLLFACQSSPAPGPTPATTPATAPSSDASKAAANAAKADKPDEAEAKAKAKADAKKQKQKELRTKQRELEAAKVEQQVAELDRSSRQLSVAAALARTAAGLERSQEALDVFLKDVKPREIAEKRIALDQSTYRAEHSKDELGELTAMYEADEFARKTKELVLKRGRRELEMAERQLAVAKQATSHFEGVTMPERERELRQKLADAELERRKAEIDDEKAKIEFAQATKKAELRLADLAEDIAELEQALAKDLP